MRKNAEKKNSIKKNFIYNLAYQILRIIIPIITTPYISRIMGAENIGIYSYSYSIATYFGLFILLGLQNYGNRTIASLRDDREKTNIAFWSIYKMQLIMSIIVIAIYIAYIIILSPNKIMAWIQAIYLLSVGLDINWFYFGIERFDLTVTKSIVIKLLSVSAIFIFIKNESDLYLYALIIALGMLLNEIVLWLRLKDFINRVKVSKKQILNHIKPNLVLFIPIIAVSVYTMMDKIMIGLLNNMKEVGYYENASKISQITTIIVSSLGTVMLPRISNLASKNKNEQIKQYLNKSLVAEALISNALAFGILSVSDLFVPIFFGENFEKCIIVLPILSMSTIFIAWANVIRTQYLIPYKKDKVYILSVMLGAVVNLILNALLIPYHGAIGAAIGTICSEITVSLTQTIKIYKEIKLGPSIIKCLPFSVIGAIMMALLITIPPSINNSMLVSLIMKIIFGAILYLVMAYLYIKYILKISVIQIYKQNNNKTT